MKALSLYHPWAMLVAIGAKRWETRPRPTSYRGTLAIQAASKWGHEISLAVENAPYVTALEASGVERIDVFRSRGHVVAICDIADCITSSEWMRRFCRHHNGILPYDHEQEYRFGNYQPGRYAYQLTNLRRLRTPYKLRGFQGMWNLTPEQEADILDLAI